MVAQFFFDTNFNVNFGGFNLENVKNTLWETYRFAINGGLTENGQPVSAEEVATLFDQLIALAGAVEALQKAGGVAPLSPEGEQQHV